MKRSLRLSLLALPAIAGLITAVILITTQADGTLKIDTRLSLALSMAGGLVSLAIALGLFARSRVQKAHDLGEEAGRAAEQSIHRRFRQRLDHELKNPITAIRAALAAEADTENSRGLAVAAAQTDRLATLVGELRSLAAIETAVIERVPVDRARLTSEEAAAIAEDLAARGVHRDIHVAFPSAPWPLPTISGDPDLLAMAVRNLLLNAAKFSGEDDRIEARGYEDNGLVILEIADTGWGIAEDEIPQVWDELWRASDARSVEGSGLGLALVRVIARLHGSNVSIRSVLGAGTSVRMEFPIPVEGAH